MIIPLIGLKCAEENLTIKVIDDTGINVEVLDANTGHSICDERLIGTLPTWLSILFFAWFFVVFTYLATRGMPKSQNGRGNILVDWIAIIVDGIRRLINSIKPPSMR